MQKSPECKKPAIFTVFYRLFLYFLYKINPTDKTAINPPINNMIEFPTLILSELYKAINFLISSKLYQPLLIEILSLSISTKTPTFNESSSKTFTNSTEPKGVALSAPSKRIFVIPVLYYSPKSLDIKAIVV